MTVKLLVEEVPVDAPRAGCPHPKASSKPLNQPIVYIDVNIIDFNAKPSLEPHICIEERRLLEPSEGLYIPKNCKQCWM
jgi:hypothetical protein